MTSTSDAQPIEVETKVETEAKNRVVSTPLVQPERRATLRLGQRQLTSISGTVVAVIVLLLLYAGYRVFVDFKITRDIIIAESNMHALYKAMSAYSLDFDSKLPTADKWTDQVAGYLSAPPGTPGGRFSYLHAEDENRKPLHYAYNDLVSDYKVEDRISPEEQRKTLELNRVVLLIEVPGEGNNEHVHIPPRNTPEGEEALARILTFPHNSSSPDKATAVVIYANGTTERLTRRDFK